MTTKCRVNKICTFKTLLSWRFPRKTVFWDDFPLYAPSAPRLKKRKFCFYCRLAVSDYRGSPVIPWLKSAYNSPNSDDYWPSLA